MCFSSCLKFDENDDYVDRNCPPCTKEEKVDKTKLYDYNHHYDDQFCAWIESSDVVNYLFSLLRSPTGSMQEICRRIIANQDYPTLTDSNHSRITQKNHLKEIRAQLRTRQQNAASNVPFEGDVCSVERLLTSYE